LSLLTYDQSVYNRVLADELAQYLPSSITTTVSGSMGLLDEHSSKQTCIAPLQWNVSSVQRDRYFAADAANCLRKCVILRCSS